MVVDQLQLHLRRRLRQGHMQQLGQRSVEALVAVVVVVEAFLPPQLLVLTLPRL